MIRLLPLISLLFLLAPQDSYGARLEGALNELHLCEEQDVCIALYSTPLAGEFRLVNRTTRFSVKTDSEGRFTRKGVSPGRYRIKRIKNREGVRLDIVEPRTKRIRIRKGSNSLFVVSAYR